MDKTEKRVLEREKMKLEFESKSHNEEFARVVVAVYMTRLDPTVEEIEDVKTAVSEAVTNAVIHGYQGKEGIICLEAEVEDRTLCLTIKDNGIGIDDVKQAMEPLYTSVPGGERSGMGFSFMEAFMDQVEVISKKGEGTTVIMRKTMGSHPFE